MKKSLILLLMLPFFSFSGEIDEQLTEKHLEALLPLNPPRVACAAVDFFVDSDIGRVERGESLVLFEGGDDKFEAQFRNWGLGSMSVEMVVEIKDVLESGTSSAIQFVGHKKGDPSSSVSFVVIVEKSDLRVRKGQAQIFSSKTMQCRTTL